MPELSFELLSNYFHLPISDAANEMQICETILKRFCRTNGISRWPHRKIRSLDNIIEQLQIKLKETTNANEIDRIKKEIRDYESKKQLVFKNPNIIFSTIVTKSTLQSFSKAKLKNIKNKSYFGHCENENEKLTVHSKIDSKTKDVNNIVNTLPHCTTYNDVKNNEEKMNNIDNNNNIDNKIYNNILTSEKVVNKNEKIVINNENNVNIIVKNETNQEKRAEFKPKIENNINKNNEKDQVKTLFPTSFITFDLKSQNSKKRKFDDFQMNNNDQVMLDRNDEFLKYKSTLPAVKYQRIWGGDSSLPLYYSILI